MTRLVGINNVALTKAEQVLRGRGLDLGETEAAFVELRVKGLA